MADQHKTREELRKQSKKTKQKKKSGKSIFKRIVIAAGIFALLCLAGGAATFAYYAKSAPKLDKKLLSDPITSEVYDKNDKLFATLGGAENRDYIEFDQIPDLVKDAVLATEDVRFYKHGGIDIRRLAGAVLANVTRGFGSEGASTLTQQVVKRSFLSEEKTLKRKAQEAWLSIQLEKQYTKDEIFEMYVNKIYYSNNIYGIETASKYYFNKELQDLKLPEAAFLAGMPQSPNNYNPYDYPDRADNRKNIVLTLMHKHGKISKQQMEEAKAISVTKTLVPEKEHTEKNKNNYAAFLDTVIKEAQEQGDYNVYADGLKIYTTLDPKAQEYTEKMLNTNEIVQFPDDKFQTGLTLLDTKTGEVRAIGGYRKQEGRRLYNYATQMNNRHPGSTIKPILDYGPAIEYLKWSTYEQVVDEPYKYSNGVEINNFDQRHLGQMSIREALYRSRNIPALKAFQAVGQDKASEFASKLGLDVTIQGESASIGAVEGISPMKLAGAYATFGNKGIYNKPHTIRKIVLRDGETTVKTSPEPQVAMKDYTAYMISDMLKDTVSNLPGATGSAAIVPGLPMAGKTGTTNYTEKQIAQFNLNRKTDVPDSWFAGYTTNYTVAVWTGYSDKKRPVSGSEQRIAQQISKNLMAFVSDGSSTPDFSKPKSVVAAEVEKGSNPPRKPSKYTPSENITKELFVVGTEPTKVSEKFDMFESPSVTGEFNEEQNVINFSWSHPRAGEETIQYEVSLSGPDGKQSLGQTSDTTMTINGPQPGASYTIEVTAIGEEQRSKPGTASVTVPSGEDAGNSDEENGGDSDEQNGNEQDEEQNGGQNDNGQNNGGQNGGNNGGQNGNGNNGGQNGGNGDSGGGGQTGNGNNGQPPANPPNRRSSGGN